MSVCYVAFVPRPIRHTRASVIARVEAEYRALDRAIRRLTPRHFRAPAFARTKRERWTVKDALAHVVAWKYFTVLSLRGERRPPEWRGLDVVTANAKIYRAWHRMPPRAVVAEHRRTHREAIAALRALPAERLSGRLRSAQWPFDLVGHSTEHRVRHIEPSLPNLKNKLRERNSAGEPSHLVSSAPTSSRSRRTAPLRRARPAARPATARRVRS